jgi:beta-lactamase regulating signal transducer with metallopeptidase domain
MIAEALSFLTRMNLALAAAVLLLLALRGMMRLWFGARVAYALWWIVPAALLAAMLPARTIEIVADVAAPHTLAPGPIAASSELSVQLPGIALVDVSSLLLASWLVGVALMLVVLALRQRRFIASLGRLSRDANGVLRAEANCAGPMIVGALRPKLVLPKYFEAQFEPAERDLMLAHERVHVRCGDARINGLAALIQCVCWFNPLAHAAAFALRIDQELACDATVAEWYPRARRAYAAAMLKAQLAPMSLPVGCAWSPRGTHELMLRIAMLKRDLPGSRRAATGSLLAALVCVTAGCVTWAAQPLREVKSNVDAISDAQLLRAVLDGDVQRAEAAIRAGADVNVRSRRAMTALTIAARTEDMRILDLLLDHGADVHLTSPGEGNALVAAGRRGHVRAVTTLVEHGATVNAIVPEYGTPLVASVRTGHFDVVMYLVAHGADVNLASPLPAPWSRWAVMCTPLQVAVRGGHISTAAYLRSMGAAM